MYAIIIPTRLKRLSLSCSHYIDAKTWGSTWYSRAQTCPEQIFANIRITGLHHHRPFSIVLKSFTAESFVVPSPLFHLRSKVSEMKTLRLENNFFGGELRRGWFDEPMSGAREEKCSPPVTESLMPSAIVMQGRNGLIAGVNSGLGGVADGASEWKLKTEEPRKSWKQNAISPHRKIWGAKKIPHLERRVRMGRKRRGKKLGGFCFIRIVACFWLHWLMKREARLIN